MKIVILAMPSDVTEELINGSIVALMNSAQITEIDVKILDTDEFMSAKGKKVNCEEADVRRAIEEIVKTCITNGNSYESIFANYMHMMSVGQLSPERIKLINKYPKIIDKITSKYSCTCLKSMLKGSQQFYGENV